MDMIEHPGVFTTPLQVLEYVEAYFSQPDAEIARVLRPVGDK